MEINLEEILTLHDEVLRQTGGASGIRDRGTLESALARPFQTFGGEDLYPDLLSKAAALMESLIVNHPFVDGNKRTGLMSGIGFLNDNGIAFTATQDHRYYFVIAVASGEMDYDGILAWLRQNTKPA